MSVKGRNLYRVGLSAVFLFAAVLACCPTAEVKAINVVINSPTGGSTVAMGQEVLIDSTATATAGIDRVDLSVDGRIVRHDTPPEGNPTTFRVVQSWTPTTEGQVAISVVAYDVQGASDQATITLQAVASGAVVPTAGAGTVVPPEATAGPGSVVPPEPTETPPPPVTTEAGCTLDAQYVADVTIPDGTVMSPEAGFVKTWRVRNSGTCDWDAGFQLTFVSGEQMSGPASVSLPAIPAGEQTDISVSLTAPSSYGTHKGTWRIRAIDGTVFGTNLTVVIEVPSPSTSTPTPTPTPTQEPTVEPTEESGMPDLVITDLEVDTSDPRQDVPLHIVATLRNQGDATAENFRWAWRVSSTQDYIEAPGSFSLEPGEETVAQLEFTFGGYATYTTEAWVDSREDVDESEEGNNTRQLVIPVHKAPPTTVTLQPVASRSGSMSSGGKGSAIRIGITQSGAPQRAFLDFDFAELPKVRQGSNVTEATLDLSGYVENPAGCLDAIGPLRVLQVNYGDSFDYPDDFDSHPVSLPSCPSTLGQLNSPINVTDAVRELIYHAGPTRIQIRLELMYDDAGAGSACTIAWANPVLNVAYQP
jgi:hypothetical protein